ncbi:hypothetical protein Gohar_021452, partial [Gossypium harknessii]|nr:hypothetical protein [Gossypium harknessii]
AEDRILECYICNLPAPPSPLVELYLREASFLHVALVGMRCKLNPIFVNTLVERKRPEMHTFHLSTRRVYYHFGGHTVIVGVIGGWVGSHWVHAAN